MSVLAQEIDAITNASEHIDFIKAMLQKHAASEERKQELLKKLHIVEQRAGDSRLHLAVLGEFSGGKSTFINALLKNRLLKSARVATTASATHITFGPVLKVKATFSSGACIEATALDTHDLSQAIARIKSLPLKILPIREAINLLTADQVIADTLKRVDIALPSRSLQSGLSIIDTPGIGAGGESTQRHAHITQAVVEQYADAAIVLIPSAQPMSYTLLSFLQNTARAFLQRCIFVVTSMDTQSEEERQKTLAFVRQTLIKQLALNNPFVYQCSAISVFFDLGAAATHESPSRQEWQDQFSRLEHVLLKEVVRQRHLMISERLTALFQLLLLELERDMQTRQDVIEKEMQQLQSAHVSVVSDRLGTQRERQHRLRLEAEGLKHDRAVLMRRQQSLEQLTTKLMMT